MYHSIDPFQYTIKKPISCCGVGLHSGRTVNLLIKPAPVNSGITFLRTDLLKNKKVRAYMDEVVDTRLATTISNGNASVSTTEHLLAAVQSYGIDNVVIELDSTEVPIMDGSAAPFIALLKNAGKKRQEKYRKILKIKRSLTYREGDKIIKISPYNGFKITGEIEFDDELIQNQTYSIDVTSERFIHEISRARTFGYVEQVEELWANGLALGGNLENVIAIHWNRNSVLNEDGLRYHDEFIRHKVLDIIGDIALLGCHVLGHIEACKSGHTQHLAFMQTLVSSPQCWEVIEFENNGSHSVLEKVFSDKRAQTAGDMFLPFFQNYNASAS